MIERVLLGGILMIGSTLLATASTEFHVAPGGKDSSPGTNRKPFATVTRARDAIRSLKEKSGLPRGGVTVYLHGGEYALTVPIVFEAQDSGATEAPIVYQAYNAEEPVFSGGVLLKAEDWKTVEDPNILRRIPDEARGEVMRIEIKPYGIETFDPLPVSGMAAGSLYARKIVPETPAGYELFFNDQALQIARWPNTGYVATGRIIASGAAPRYWGGEQASGKSGNVSRGERRGRGGESGPASPRPRPTPAAPGGIRGLGVRGYREVAPLSPASKLLWPYGRAIRPCHIDLDRAAAFGQAEFVEVEVFDQDFDCHGADTPRVKAGFLSLRLKEPVPQGAG